MQHSFDPRLIAHLEAIAATRSEMPDGDHTADAGTLMTLLEDLYAAIGHVREAISPTPPPDPDEAAAKLRREQEHRDHWERYREATPGVRTPIDWTAECRLGPGPDDADDWQPEDFPGISAKELDLLGCDVMDRGLAGPDPVDRLVKGVRAYFAQNPY